MENPEGPREIGGDSEGSVDRISALPEGLVHHILSFLVTKEAIQIAATCKRLNQVWTTIPFFDLDLDLFPALPSDEDTEDDAEDEEGDGEDNGDEGEGDAEDDAEDQNSEDDDITFQAYSEEELSQIMRNREQLFTFVEQTLTSRRMQGLTIERFRLSVMKLDAAFRQKLDPWIEYLLHCNVKELVLRVGDSFYDLPLTLLTAKSLYELNLMCCKLPSGSISLPSLRKLHLELVYLDEHFLKDLVNACRDLEDLCLDGCMGLKEIIHVSGLSKLRVLKLTPDSEEVNEIVVEAQHLKELILSETPLSVKINIITGIEASLKCLTLYSVSITNTWLRELISRLGCLEELVLSNTGLKAIEISSTRLKQLGLLDALSYEDNIFGEFTITTPNLVCLSYAGGLSSRFVNRLAVKEVLLEIDDLKTIPAEQLCGKLIQFLHVFDYSEVVALDCSYFEHMIFRVEKRLNLIAPFPHIKHLILRGRFGVPPIYSIATLLETFLWISPNLESLSFEVSFHGKGFPVDLFIEFTSDLRDCSAFPWSCSRNCSSHGKFKAEGGDDEFYRFLRDKLNLHPVLKGL